MCRFVADALILYTKYISHIVGHIELWPGNVTYWAGFLSGVTVEQEYIGHCAL